MIHGIPELTRKEICSTLKGFSKGVLALQFNSTITDNQKSIKSTFLVDEEYPPTQ
jgi:hypothetical protein